MLLHQSRNFVVSWISSRRLDVSANGLVRHNKLNRIYISNLPLQNHVNNVKAVLTFSDCLPLLFSYITQRCLILQTRVPISWFTERQFSYWFEQYGSRSGSPLSLRIINHPFFTNPIFIPFLFPPHPLWLPQILPFICTRDILWWPVKLLSWMSLGCGPKSKHLVKNPSSRMKCMQLYTCKLLG